MEITEMNEIDQIKEKVLEDVDIPTKKKKRKERIKRHLRAFAELAVLAIVILIIFRIIIGMAPIEGDSMYPTLHAKDTVFYNRLAKNYMRNDVVVIERPGGELYVKRIVAVAGDTVNLDDGKLYVNGRQIEEKWAYGETSPTKGGLVYPVTMKEGQIFVLGDNRELSDDSRMFGSVNVEDTKGKLLWYAGKL